MISNRRQALPFFVVLLMVVSVFAFTPASAASSILVTLDADNGPYSFASVNGSAEYTVTIVNDGDVDFEEVEISASFMDETWLSENVTFSASGDEDSPGSLLLGPLASSAVIQVQISATVGYGAKVDFSQVPMEINIEAYDDGGESASVGLGVFVCVTNWIAYESNFPNQPSINTFNMSDSYDYQIVVENIAVTKNLDNTTASMPIRDRITVQYSGISGWTVTSDDEGWNPMYGGVLNGMDTSASHTWNVAIELTGNAKAGGHVIDFQATSTDPDDPMGGMPYIQPYGMTAIPVSAAEWYGVSVSGAGSRNVDLSEGSAISTWNVAVNNLGNTKDTFSITWDNSGVPAGWTLSAQPDTSGQLDWQASSSFDISLTVPADVLAGASASFSMTATSSNSVDETASQSFTATVDQHYGVLLSVDSDSKSKAPGGVVDFIFNVTNTGNGEDTFGIMVEGPALWTPTASQSNITISAVSSSQFMVSVTIPEDRSAGAESGDIIVTVSSSDGESTANHSVSVSTSQVYDISMDHVSGSDGTATIIQDVAVSLSLNVTNNGNGVDTVTLAMENQPPWAALGADSIQIGPGQTIAIVINLSPDTAALSGRDYIFQVVATSADGSEITSPDLTAQIEVKETGGEEVVTEELDEDDEGGLPGFSMFVSLLALTIVVLSRRKD
uniref:Alpha-galactosidase NEW3 domain-containing protein n=1 Tax=uncultured marine group II/III euryarchaeote SAT1000_24_G08 TaxID=1456569 RepID=A0A075IBM4_9EURY|nr:hypothetical protein [uncultured marine group II/III euryarchaeote SAT1000_24_G08]